MSGSEGSFVRSAAEMKGGFVSLIGGGPGDVGLLTLRGRDALAQADIVLFDALANPELLNFCPQAHTVYVGKKGFAEHTPQEEIHRLLIHHALANGGQRVARLKGGDAFVFGRGGEEALACVAAGIPFEVIPGVSSSIAAAAYAGIPVTHRGVARNFSVVTGRDLGGTYLPAHLSQADTLVILMGLHSVVEISASLLGAGRDPLTPVAAIERASHIDQRVILTTLGEMADAVPAAVLQGPAVLVVGEVAALHRQLAWFQPPQSLPTGSGTLPPGSTLRHRPSAAPQATKPTKQATDMTLVSSRPELAALLQQSAALHGHLCPRQVLGTRSALLAGAWLRLEFPRADKRVMVFVETDGCYADGVSVASGCWLGRRTMRLVDHGKVAATFVDTKTARAVRVAPQTDLRKRVKDSLEKGQKRYQAYLEAYQTWPDEALLDAVPVTLKLDLTALVSGAGKRAVCNSCGEEIINERELQREGQVLCQSCAGEAYVVLAT